MEDRVTIKTGDTRVVVERGRIAKINSRAQKTEKPNPPANVTAG
jgi:hypothetical protein